jgi:hypothetical protein
VASSAVFEVLHRLQSTGFSDLAGARVSADVPIPEHLINEVVAAALPPNLPLREVSIRPEAGDQFSVRLTPRTAMLPPITVKLAIERQPDFPQSPVLVLRMKTMGGLFGFASAALPLGNMLPPGVRLDGERILVDLRAMTAQKGIADLLQYVRELRVTTEDGRVILHLNAAV